MGNRLDVRDLAQGRWRSILTVLGIDERALSGSTALARCAEVRTAFGSTTEKAGEPTSVPGAARVTVCS